MKQLITYAICLFTMFTFAQNAKIDSLTVRLAYQKQDSNKIETSLQLINELYIAEDYKKALLFITQTTELSKTLNYDKGLAESSFIKGLIYKKRDDYLNALNNFETSKTYFTKIKDTLGIARVNNSLGIIEIKRGNFNKGLKSSLSAIEIFEDNNLNKELSNAYNNLADAYFSVDEFKKSLDYYKKTLNIQERLNDKNGLKHTLKNIGSLYSLTQEHRQAIEYYERALNITDPINDKDLRGEILPQIGKSHLEINELEKAASYLREGLKYHRLKKNQEGILQSLNAFAHLNIKNYRLKLAETQLNEAYRIAKQIDNKEAMLENIDLQLTLSSNRKQYKSAFEWQSQYYTLKSQLDKAKQEKRIARLGKNPELTTDTASTVEKESSKSQLEVIEPKAKKNDVLLLYALIAGLIFISALLIFSYLKGSKDSKALKITSKENKELAQKNNQLEEVNQVKDKLFSIVSHDLKDSISSIKAFLDLLKDDGITKDEFNELIPELSENANNASSLLFNLLNWSKSQMQNLQPKPELFNIQEVFQIKMSLIEKKVQDKGIILIDESRREFVYADRSMLEIVIQNLITNAVKFTGKGDVITVSNQDYNGKVLICVEDTGIGISEENIEKLFNAKKNFTTIGTENEKGTGLGLTICKDLVELNDGRIWVESTPNIGSKFFIELPKAALSK